MDTLPAIWVGDAVPPVPEVSGAELSGNTGVGVDLFKGETHKHPSMYTSVGVDLDLFKGETHEHPSMCIGCGEFRPAYMMKGHMRSECMAMQVVCPRPGCLCVLPCAAVCRGG